MHGVKNWPSLFVILEPMNRFSKHSRGLRYLQKQAGTCKRAKISVSLNIKNVLKEMDLTEILSLESRHLNH